MKLELEKTHWKCFEGVVDTTVIREETLETIVPDACPDILRLIDTQGKVVLKSKEVADGRFMLAGTAQLTVLYQPDNETDPVAVEVAIPFNITEENRNVTSDCVVTAVPHLVDADTRPLNPRKILTRMEIAIHVCIYRLETMSFSSGVLSENASAEVKKEIHHPYCISAIQEKPFSFEENLILPAGRPTADKLITNRVELFCREAKLIGNKVIFKGEAAVMLLYRPEGGGLANADFSLPFSQIAEVIGVHEDGTARVDVCLNGAEFRLGSDGRTVSASLSLTAQLVVQEEREVEILTDTYSTCCAVETEMTSYVYPSLRNMGVGRQAVRQLVETGISIRSVINVYCLIGQTAQKRERDKTNLISEMILTVVGKTEDGDYSAVSRRLEVAYPIELPEECRVCFDCSCCDMVASPVAEGVDIRFAVEFPYFCFQMRDVMMVESMTFTEREEEDLTNRPSLVLRKMGTGESLWDIAKRYATTVEDIVCVNGIEEENTAAGTMLLIPRKR